MTTHARGRPREFDQDAALDAALDLFWRNGYRDTTTRELELALGISQSSIYNAFGAKADLLLHAIDRYERRIKGELLGMLLVDDDGYASLLRFFTELAGWVVRTEHRGCLVVNLMAGEFADPRITERVRRYRTTIRDGLQAALGRTGVPTETANRRANLLLPAVLGLHITVRTAIDTTEVDDMLAGITAQIIEWRGAAPPG